MERRLIIAVHAKIVGKGRARRPVGRCSLRAGRTLEIAQIGQPLLLQTDAFRGIELRLRD